MYKRRGFTLIELLVVVLIIGILSAVALPQYQKAVKKTRLMRWAPLVKTMANAEEVYYLENAVYTSSSNELDVSWPSGVVVGNAADDGYLRLADGTVVDLLGTFGKISDGMDAYVSARSQDGVYYIQYLEHSPYPGKRVCKGDEMLCKSFGGESLNGGWIIP